MHPAASFPKSIFSLFAWLREPSGVSSSGITTSMQTASIIVYVYAFLVCAGGLFGYVKAKSLPSLIMGQISFLILLAAGYGIGAGKTWGEPLALGLALVLLVFFSLRYLRSSPRAFMPGGLMAILSLFTLLGVVLTAHQK